MKTLSWFVGLALFLFGPAHADDLRVPVLSFLKVDGQKFTSLESLVDEFTVDYVTGLAADDEAEEEETDALEVTPEGYRFGDYLIIDLSELDETTQGQLIAKLRNIFLEGQPWRGKTYRYPEGRVGFSSDIDRSIAQSRTQVRKAKIPGRPDLSAICDSWLTKMN